MGKYQNISEILDRFYYYIIGFNRTFYPRHSTSTDKQKLNIDHSHQKRSKIEVKISQVQSLLSWDTIPLGKDCSKGSKTCRKYSVIEKECQKKNRPGWIDGRRKWPRQRHDIGFVLLQRVGEGNVVLELLRGERRHGLQVRVELGDDSQVDVQLALNDVSECDVVRKPELIPSFNKLSISEIIFVLI